VRQVLPSNDHVRKRHIARNWAEKVQLAIAPLSQRHAATTADSIHYRQELTVRNAIRRLLHEQNQPMAYTGAIADWPVRAVHECFWRRDDPTIQLSPGATREITVSLRVGVSEECAREIAWSLGIPSVGVHILGLSAKLSQKSRTNITLTSETERIVKQSHSNPSNTLYRRIAVWHVVHRLSIIGAKPQPSGRESLLPPHPGGREPLLSRHIKPFPRQLICQTTEFVASDTTSETYADAPPRYRPAMPSATGQDPGVGRVPGATQ